MADERAALLAGQKVSQLRGDCEFIIFSRLYSFCSSVVSAKDKG